jgi:hypothetical protein
MAVEIPGLKALLADLQDMPKDIQDILPRMFKDVAETVAQDAARRVPSQSGNAIASIRSKGTKRGGAIVAGGRDAPYFKWLDFGSRSPRTGNTRDEGPWRGSGAGPKGGRYVYPAIEDNWDKTMEACMDAVDRAAKEAGFR